LYENSSLVLSNGETEIFKKNQNLWAFKDITLMLYSIFFFNVVALLNVRKMKNSNIANISSLIILALNFLFLFHIIGMKLIIDTENAEHIILHDKDIIQIHELFIGKKDLAKPNISNIKLERIPRRNGIVGTTKEGDVAIPLTDPGLSFNRRLPFSNRYVPIDKQRLIDNQFQLATQLPYLQSLAEKYAIWSGVGLGAAYAGLPQLHDANKKYIMEPFKKQYNNFDTALKNMVGIDTKKQFGGGIQLSNRMYEEGGEYELSQEEIQDLKNQGYDIELL
jgi:hypothetical protein